MQEASAVNTIAQSIAISFILGFFTVLAGCETPSQAGDGAGRLDGTPVVRSTDSASLEADPQVNEFVAQAQRDVEHLMSLSQRPSTEAAPQAPESGRQNDIQWILPASSAATETSIPTPVSEAEPSQGSLAANQSTPTPPVSPPQTNRTRPLSQ